MPTIITAHMANANSTALAGAIIPIPAGIMRNPVMSIPPISMSAASQST